MSRCCSLAAGLKAGTTTVVVAQQAPPEVTFQVEVNYVDVDAIVTDDKGNFVTGLTRDDFEVFEDGKPQKIEMFSYVELPVERPDRFGCSIVRSRATRARTRGRSTDAWYSSCSTISISARFAAALVSSAAREFVERHFGANDLAAVVYTSGRADATQDFTNDRALLAGRHRQVRRAPAAIGRDRSARASLPETS